MQVGLEMIKIQCFCSSQHSWWLLLWSVRGAQCWGCLLLTPPQDSEGVGLSFCGGWHWWWLLWSARGVWHWGCLLVTPAQGSKGIQPQLLWWSAWLVTPPLVYEGSLVSGLPAGDSYLGFQGESASAAAAVGIVGSLNPYNMQNLKKKS